MTFADRYGPWAVVAGASEGVGAAFAATVAQFMIQASAHAMGPGEP